MSVSYTVRQSGDFCIRETRVKASYVANVYYVRQDVSVEVPVVTVTQHKFAVGDKPFKWGKCFVSFPGVSMGSSFGEETQEVLNIMTNAMDVARRIVFDRDEYWAGSIFDQIVPKDRKEQ